MSRKEFAHMIPEEIAIDLHEVPEEVIKEFVNSYGDKSVWKRMSNAAKVFRHAGATPIFLATPDNSQFCVSSEETFRTRLH